MGRRNTNPGPEVETAARAMAFAIGWIRHKDRAEHGREANARLDSIEQWQEWLPVAERFSRVLTER